MPPVSPEGDKFVKTRVFSYCREDQETPLLQSCTVEVRAYAFETTHQGASEAPQVNSDASTFFEFKVLSELGTNGQIKRSILNGKVGLRYSPDLHAGVAPRASR